MSETESFNCPNCGSSLMADGAKKEIKCKYCGSTVIVPEELRDDDLDEDDELTPEEDVFSPQHVQWLVQNGMDATFKVDIVSDRGETRNKNPVVNLYLKGNQPDGRDHTLEAEINVPRKVIPRRGTMIRIKYHPEDITDFALQIDGQFYSRYID